MKSKIINLYNNISTFDICLDELSNSYDLDFLESIKIENKNNTKLILYLYKSLFRKPLNKKHLKINVSINIEKLNLNYLIEINTRIIDDLESIKSNISNPHHNNILIYLYNSYSNFLSISKPIINNRSNPLDTTNIFNASENEFDVDDTTSDLFSKFRKIALQKICYTFDACIKDTDILEEYSDIFFRNNPNLRFHQYFLKTKLHIYKVRINEKNSEAFYLYQKPMFELDSNELKHQSYYNKIVNDFLKDKFSIKYHVLQLNDNLTTLYEYENIPETYTFTYSYLDGSISKLLVISIDVSTNLIYELEILDEENKKY